MRRVFQGLVFLLILGVLVAAVLRTGQPPPATGTNGATYPGPHTPAPVYPTVVGHPAPTPIRVTPPPNLAQIDARQSPRTTPSPSVPLPTPTFHPLPTILPTQIPPNLPTPTDLPPQLPYTSTFRVSDANGWPLAKQVDSSAYVVRARVARIDPPFWATPNRQRPAVITFQNVATPALLNVLHVYKGPPMSTIEVALPGACFSPTDCTLLSMQYQWRDVVGYDLILFLVAIPPPPSGVSALPAQAGPFLTWVVNPNSAKDDVLFINGPSPVHQSLSQLETGIRAAPSANH